MSQETTPDWATLQTDESKLVVAGISTVFGTTNAYQYNPASIRVRVIDSAFEGRSPGERDAMVEPLIEALPEETQAKIINLYTFAPSELTQFSRASMLNEEFEHPSQSML